MSDGLGYRRRWWRLASMIEVGSQARLVVTEPPPPVLAERLQLEYFLE